MSATHSHDVPVPRLPLAAMALLVLLTLLAVAAVRWSGAGRSPSQPTAEVVAERALRFEDRPDGGITVRQHPEGQLVLQIAPGEQPFIRGVLRALVRERRGAGLGDATPFVLQARTDGRLTLNDGATGRRIDIESFGPTQAAAFARLLPNSTADSR